MGIVRHFFVFCDHGSSYCNCGGNYDTVCRVAMERLRQVDWLDRHIIFIMLRVFLTYWKHMIIGFRPYKCKSVLITVGYHKSYKIIERTHNIIIFSLASPTLSGQSLPVGFRGYRASRWCSPYFPNQYSSSIFGSLGMSDCIYSINCLCIWRLRLRSRCR